MISWKIPTMNKDVSPAKILVFFPASHGSFWEKGGGAFFSLTVHRNSSRFHLIWELALVTHDASISLYVILASYGLYRKRCSYPNMLQVKLREQELTACFATNRILYLRLVDIKV